MVPPPPQSTLFPYTTLFRSSPQCESAVAQVRAEAGQHLVGQHTLLLVIDCLDRFEHAQRLPVVARDAGQRLDVLREDRKSTRLNSSHRCISYAVFCLKKKIT